MSTGIYIEDCGEVTISNSRIVGYDRAIVAKNVKILAGTGNTIRSKKDLEIDAQMREFLCDLYDQHKVKGHKHALRKMAKNQRLKQFAQERGLELGTFLATFASLFK